MLYTYSIIFVLGKSLNIPFIRVIYFDTVPHFEM